MLQKLNEVIKNELLYIPHTTTSANNKNIEYSNLLKSGWDLRVLDLDTHHVRNHGEYQIMI